MGRKRASNPQNNNNNNVAIVVALISLIGTVTTAFFTYLSAAGPSDFEVSIIATQTAEVKQTAAAQVLAFNPAINNALTPTHSSTEVSNNLIITETPIYTDVTQTIIPLDITLTATVQVTTIPLPTNTPENYIDPTAFITNYFSLINERRYEEAWSKLSTKFKENFSKRTDGGGYDEYVDYWNTVAKVEIAFIEIQSQSNSNALVYAEILFNYKAGNTETGHITYKLVKDSTGKAWLFDPN